MAPGDPSELNLCPAWHVGHLDMIGPFGWHKVTAEELRAVRDKLKSFESMTWHQILQPGDSHNVETHKLCKEVRDHILETHLEAYEQFFSLRLTGAQRIWGVREGRVLRLLWWDPEHLVCPSHKKNT